MSANQSLTERISNEVAALSYKDVLKPYKPVGICLSEFGKKLAAMNENKNLWIETGFDWSRWEYWKALDGELFRSISDVIVNRKKEAVSRWIQAQEKMETESRRMTAALNIACRNDKRRQNTLRMLKKGRSNAKRVMNFSATAKYALKNLHLIENLSVGGVPMNEEYFVRMKDWSIELFEMLVQANAARKRSSEKVIYRNKLIMLCRKAEKEIDLWLDAVYMKNPSRKKTFTSKYYRNHRRKSISSDRKEEKSPRMSAAQKPIASGYDRDFSSQDIQERVEGFVNPGTAVTGTGIEQTRIDT